MSSAGDVNGDGYSDVLVGAPLYNNSLSNGGRVFLFYGSATGLSTTPAWTFDSNQASAQLGYAVSSAGDVNKDGYSDVIVGAPYYSNNNLTENGCVFAFYGSPTGLKTTPSWTACGGQSYGLFGWSISSAGDVNKDGYSDIIIGAPYQNTGFGLTNAGRVFAYYGSATGLSATPNWTGSGIQFNAQFGDSVSTAGDVNKDGYSDIIVGAYLYSSNGLTNNGRAYVFYGSSSGIKTRGNWTADGVHNDAEFGYSVGTAGDVNGDGYSDIIIGAAYDSNTLTWEGRAFVYYGSATGPATTPSWTTYSGQAYALYGWSVGTAGDVNHDGYSDAIVTAPLYDYNAHGDEGRVFVYYGSATGLSASPNATLDSGVTGVEVGYSASAAGDVKKNGGSNVIVGAPFYDANGYTNEGRAFLYSGTVHDVAVTKVTVSRMFAYTGIYSPVAFNSLPTKVNVTVSNLGSFPENVTVTAKANSTLLGTRTITGLAADASMVVTFNFNTTSLVKGNYVISGQASQVAGDANPNNNALTMSGTLQVRKAGDVDGDGAVDITDLIQVFLHQFTRLIPSPYDVDNDGGVDITDQIITFLDQFT